MKIIESSKIVEVELFFKDAGWCRYFRKTISDIVISLTPLFEKLRSKIQY